MSKELDKRQLAREYFNIKGLNYSDIKSEDIHKLQDFIKYELQTYLPTTNHSRSMDLRLSKIRKKDYIYNKDGTLKFACIYIQGSYFDYREGVCFNDDGFIGLCGWADGSNQEPIINAFIKWCNYLSNKKEAKSEVGK